LIQEISPAAGNPYPVTIIDGKEDHMNGKNFEKLWKTEDWWSVWLGLGIVLLAIVEL